MKKLLLGLLGLAVCGIAMLGLFKLGYNVGYCDAKDEDTFVCELEEDRNAAYVPTDEESMNRRIREDFGADYYGELINSENPDDVIEFMVYDSEGTARYIGTYERFSSCTTYTPTADNL